MGLVFKNFQARVVFLVVMSAAWHAACNEQPVAMSEVQARIRYAAKPGALTLRASAPLTVIADGVSHELRPGEWRIVVMDVIPARRRYHLFPKTFQPAESRELQEYLDHWQSRGYAPQTETFGMVFRSEDQRTFDNRVHWVSLARFDTKQEAEALRDRLAEEQVWAWMRPETVTRGTARMEVRDSGGTVVFRSRIPVELRCSQPLEIVDLDSGFWREKRADRLVQPPLSLEIGPDGDLEVYGRLSVETYLRGVIPAEMPAGWHREALKAQAVAARSEIYASLAGKHRLEGFDFTMLETCRAYWGLGGHHPATDAAVTETAGQVLAHNGKIMPTVFSSCCGGWTENNENVWSGPPNPILRGISDAPTPSRPISNLRSWLASSPPAWCAGDTAHFRWQRRYTTAELSAMVNKHHRVGTVQAVEEGARGVSGRLKSVTIRGSGGKVTVQRELPIRRVFGGLPSAMFVVSVAGESGAGRVYTFHGGGRGHGVGLCQHGARGMAEAGRDYRAILTHYFSGITIERTR